MKRFTLETAVGLFLMAGFACFAYLAVRLGDLPLIGGNSYDVSAEFTNISGLKEGADILLAGVKVGKVARIGLAKNGYDALVILSIDRGVRIQDDVIASIRTAGIIGDKYVSLKPGASEEYLAQGGRIMETESALDIEELISKYIFEKKS